MTITVITGILLLGLSIVQAQLTGRSICPFGRRAVNCFADPCQVTTCPNFPQATCVANYCFGCNADFFLYGRKLTRAECTCPRNYGFNRCGRCERTCENPRPICTSGCRRRGCRCPWGLVWSSRRRRCVPEWFCRGGQRACPGNQVYYQCAPCQRTCENPRPICTLQCRRGCRCPRGLVWNSKNGLCVPQRLCWRGSTG